MIEVHNEGEPIPPEDQSLIFYPYQRSRSAETSGTKGWGLGLVLVRGIVDAHGGEVGVNSTLEEGTTFWVEFPLMAPN